MKTKIKVGIVYGGRSGEHDVSLETAFGVLQEFNYDKYEFCPIYITKDGKWLVGNALTKAPTSIDGLKQVGLQEPVPGESLIALLQNMITGVKKAKVDVIFPLLHGTFGEDGTIQGLLEMANLPYVGAGVLTSAVAMDKVMMKRLGHAVGLPQLEYRAFTKSEWEKDQESIMQKIEQLGYPSFVKPANLGSSVGISKVMTQQQLVEGIEAALHYDRKIVVEEFVDAREIEISVLGNEELQTSVPGEICSSNEFYDYNAKYVDNKSQIVIPAELPVQTKEKISELAKRAFRAIDGQGLCRADFFVRRQDGALFFNEINTMPGFTPISMYPRMWEKSGISYRQLLDKLIELALIRHHQQNEFVYTR